MEPFNDLICKTRFQEFPKCCHLVCSRGITQLPTLVCTYWIAFAFINISINNPFYDVILILKHLQYIVTNLLLQRTRNGKELHKIDEMMILKINWKLYSWCFHDVLQFYCCQAVSKWKLNQLKNPIDVLMPRYVSIWALIQLAHLFNAYLIVSFIIFFRSHDRFEIVNNFHFTLWLHQIVHVNCEFDADFKIIDPFHPFDHKI